jgi:putative salt-induced outer membrane protein
MRECWLLLPLSLCATVAAQAQSWRAPDRTAGMLADAAQGRERKDGFFGAISAGYVASRGNSANTSVNLGATVGYLASPWRHVAAIKGLYGASDEGTNASAFSVNEQSDYTFGETHYLFVALSGDRDRFAAYESRAAVSVGYGHNFLHTEHQALDLQIGVGERQTTARDDTRTREGIATLGASYSLKVAEQADYAQQLTIERGAANTYAESNSTLKVSLRDDLALSVSLLAKFNSNVPPSNVHTDTTTLVSLIYRF